MPHYDVYHNSAFGCSVALSKSFAIVGAYYDVSLYPCANGNGSVYIFPIDGTGVPSLDEFIRIDSGCYPLQPSFGFSVSIFDASYSETVLVGAPTYYQYGLEDVTRTGSAHIFWRHEGGENNWGEQAILLAEDGDYRDYFGLSVSISGENAIVGAPGDDDSGNASGSAYIFSRNNGGAFNWGEVAKLTASDGAERDYFGWSVSISGETVIVGAKGDDDNGDASGSAYIFSQNHGGINNWGQVAKLTANDGTERDFFGQAVSIGPIPFESLEGEQYRNGEIAIIGAYCDDDNGANSGSAYVFSRNNGGVDNWGEVAKLTASDGAAGDYFGNSVSFSDGTATIGTNNFDGSVYIYEVGEFFNSSLDFDGADDIVDCGNDASLDLTNAFTIESWLYYSGGEVYPRIIDKAPSYVFYIKASNQRFRFGGTSGGITTQVAFDDYVIPLNTWIHAALTYEDNAEHMMNLYINGTLVSTNSTFSGSLDTNTEPMTIGNRPDTNLGFDGMLDELRIWNDVRTATEIQENMNTEIDANDEANLIAYYNFNRLNGDILNDFKNNNDGTLTNMNTTEDWVVSGAFTTWTGSFDTDWDTNVNWTNGVPDGSPTSNAGIPDVNNDPVLSANQSVNHLVVGSGSGIDPGSNILSVGGNLHDFAGVFSSGTFNCDGETPQVICGDAEFNNLTINNSSGVTLGSPISVSGQLTLTDGHIQTDASNILTLGPSATVSGGSDASYVRGPLERQTSSTGSYDFPVGQNPYRPVTLRPSTDAAATFKVQYFAEGYGTYNLEASDLYSVSTTEYWDITQTSGDQGLDSLKLAWGGTGPGYDVEHLTLAHWSGNEWQEAGRIDWNGDFASDGCAIVDPPSLSPWTFGGSNSDQLGIDDSLIPDRYFLDLPYPNPFNASLKIPYELPKKSHTTIDIYDLQGRNAATLLSKEMNAGYHSITWNANSFSSGIYIVVFTSEDYHLSRKIILLK